MWCRSPPPRTEWWRHRKAIFVLGQKPHGCRLVPTETRWGRAGKLKEMELSGVSSDRGGGGGRISQSLAHYKRGWRHTARTSDMGLKRKGGGGGVNPSELTEKREGAWRSVVFLPPRFWLGPEWQVGVRPGGDEVVIQPELILSSDWLAESSPAGSRLHSVELRLRNYAKESYAAWVTY